MNNIPVPEEVTVSPFISDATAPEAWQFLYLLIIGLSTLLLFMPIAKDLRSGPNWVTMLAGLAVLVWCTPYGLTGVFMLHATLLGSQAPLGASVIASAFSIGAVWLTIRAMFPWIRNVRPH